MRASPKQQIIGLIVVIAVLFVVMVILQQSPANKRAAGTAPSATVGPYDAWAACRTAVASRLKAPATADFPGYSGDYVHTDGDDYMVAAYVDSDNGFGAHVRSRFTCRVSHSGASLAVTDVSVS